VFNVLHVYFITFT